MGRRSSGFVGPQGVIREQVDAADGGERPEESGDLTHVVGGIVDGGDDGDANPDVLMELGESAEVLEDELVGDAGMVLMLGVIEEFDVVEEEVGKGDEGFEVGPGGVAGGVDGGVEVMLAAELEDGEEELVLEEGFAAGERDAAGGL